MDYTSLIGPAVVAAAVSGFISVVGLIVSTRTAHFLHAAKLGFDREQAERKANADIALATRKLEADLALAGKKFELDARLTDRKRRQDLAEKVLSGFYQM